MPTFNIYNEHSLGFTHYGEVRVEGQGTVELTDEEVQKLVDLICENNGCTDIKELKLEERYPDIYETLREAHHDVAYRAEYNHWVIEGYENGYYEIDDEDPIEKCEREYGFQYTFDLEKYVEEHGYDPEEVKSIEDIDEYELEDDKLNAFDNWVEEYRKTLNEDEDADFLAYVFEINVEVDNVDYEVEIPNEIVRMAEEKLR